MEATGRKSCRRCSSGLIKQVAVVDPYRFFFFFSSSSGADEFCEGYPHNFTPTPGYWIECSRQSGRSRPSDREASADRHSGGGHHGIQEEGSQEDGSNSCGDSDSDGSSSQSDDDEDAAKDPAAQKPSNGGAGASMATTAASSFNTSTDVERMTAGGRKVQLVHQHIQVPPILPLAHTAPSPPLAVAKREKHFSIDGQQLESAPLGIHC